MVKLDVLPWSKSMRASGRLDVSYSLLQIAQTAWGSSAIFLTTPTHGLCSLGLGAARRVAPCRRPAHSALVPIGYECAAGWVTRGP
jgi:hypothetical protein